MTLHMLAARLRRIMPSRRAAFDPLTMTAREAERSARANRHGLIQLLAAINRYAPPEAVWYDVGANIGEFARLAVRRVHPRVVHAFEAVPHLAEIARQRTAGLLPPVGVHVIALGDRDGSVTIYTAADGNPGWNTAVASQATPDMRPITAPIMRLDDYVTTKSLPLPKVMKIDVEGFEAAVLRGAMNTIRSARPVILCEVGWGRSRPDWPDVCEALRGVLATGYDARTVHGQPLDIDTLTATTDVLFVPR